MNNEEMDDEEMDDDVYDIEDNDTILCKNINPSLAKLIGIDYVEDKQMPEKCWIPPTKSGLDNSDVIIPYMYFQKNKIFNNNNHDFFRIIKEDIVNYQKLSYYQLQYIKNLTNEALYEIIELYNEVLDSAIRFLV